MTPPNHNGAALQAAAPTAQIITLSELQPASNAAAVHAVPPAAPLAETNPLHQVKATVTVRAGRVVLTVGELLGVRENQVLRLDTAVSDPVDLLIEGKVVARGQLVAIEDHFGVRITELAQPLKV
ncbi:MAG TPA: FliM/FliN family flagellar motor switch protein [Ramlibacter sp.]|nr:FliM/FliN family flagellar motor switch protein [Ramlibacter sp.]